MDSQGIGIVALLLLICATPTRGQTIVDGKLGETLDVYCQQQALHGLTGSVLVVKDNRVILQKGYGLANRQTTARNQPNTRFEIASLAKQFTAAAILKLEEEGKLSTDDPINTHLPEVPKAYQNVTIYHLLTHTGGLPRGGSGRGNDLAAAVKQHLSQPPLLPVGRKYSYSNVDYALLAGIVETASGMSMEDYCRSQLFEPAMMPHTGFCGEKFDSSSLALGYNSDGEEQGRRPDKDPYPPHDAFGYEYRGMGGVITNVTDLHKWIVALQGDTVLSSDSRRKLFQPYRCNYACGWEVFSFPEGQRCFGHGGVLVPELSRRKDRAAGL